MINIWEEQDWERKTPYRCTPGSNKVKCVKHRKIFQLSEDEKKSEDLRLEKIIKESISGDVFTELTPEWKVPYPDICRCPREGIGEQISTPIFCLICTKQSRKGNLYKAMDRKKRIRLKFAEENNLKSPIIIQGAIISEDHFICNDCLNNKDVEINYEEFYDTVFVKKIINSESDYNRIRNVFL